MLGLTRMPHAVASCACASRGSCSEGSHPGRGSHAYPEMQYARCSAWLLIMTEEPFRTACWELATAHRYLGETFGVEAGLYPELSPKRGEAMMWIVWTNTAVAAGRALMAAMDPSKSGADMLAACCRRFGLVAGSGFATLVQQAVCRTPQQQHKRPSVRTVGAVAVYAMKPSTRPHSRMPAHSKLSSGNCCFAQVSTHRY